MGYQISNNKKITANLISVTNLSNTSSSQSSNSASSSDSQAPTLADVLQGLEDQVQLLTTQMAEVRSELGILNLSSIFVRDLKRGDSGVDVSKLQEILGELGNLYATSTITGYYGSLTEGAVSKFQTEEGLKSTGIVDAATRNKIIKSVADFMANESTSTGFVSIDLSSVPDLQTLSDLQSQVSESASSSTNASNTPLALGDLQNQIDQLTLNSSDTQASIADLEDQVSQLSSELSNTQNNIATTPLPAPATPQPLAISNVQAINISKTSSTIAWATNNPATSQVNYSQNSSLQKNQTTAVSVATLITSHSLTLSSLNAGTTYYYYILSTDSNGSTASSTILSFSTLH